MLTQFHFKLNLNVVFQIKIVSTRFRKSPETCEELIQSITNFYFFEFEMNHPCHKFFIQILWFTTCQFPEAQIIANPISKRFQILKSFSIQRFARSMTLEFVPNSWRLHYSDTIESYGKLYCLNLWFFFSKVWLIS